MIFHWLRCRARMRRGHGSAMIALQRKRRLPAPMVCSRTPVERRRRQVSWLAGRHASRPRLPGFPVASSYAPRGASEDADIGGARRSQLRAQPRIGGFPRHRIPSWPSDEGRTATVESRSVYGLKPSIRSISEPGQAARPGPPGGAADFERRQQPWHHPRRQRRRRSVRPRVQRG